MKFFDILPSGIIVGGTANYEIHEDGWISYFVNVDVKVLFFKKQIQFDGTYRVDPEYLNPSGLSVGKQILIGKLLLRVLSIKGEVIQASVEVTGQDMAGTAVLLGGSRPQVELSNLEAKATVKGFKLNIKVVPKLGRRGKK